MRTSSPISFGQRVAVPIAKAPSELILRARPKRKTLDELKQAASNRRKYRRIKIRLSGRFMREDKQEFPCYTDDISAGGMRISAGVKCEVGEYLVFYLDEIGRIEGYVVRVHDDGFALAIEASSHKREKLVASLTWLLNRHELKGVDARRYERQTPSNPQTTLTRADGSLLAVKVLDLSIGGARINVNVSMGSGEKVTLGKSSGYVVRIDQDGVAIQFDTEQNQHLMHQYFK